MGTAFTHLEAICQVNRGSTGCAYAAVIILTHPNQSIYTSEITTLGSLGWPLELVVNVCVTGAIASRLWYMGRAVSRAGTGSTGISKTNAYTGPILTIIESGAILIALTFTMLVLYKTGNPAALMCTDIATQIAVSARLSFLFISRPSSRSTSGLGCRLSSRISSLFASGSA